MSFPSRSRSKSTCRDTSAFHPVASLNLCVPRSVSVTQPLLSSDASGFHASADYPVFCDFQIQGLRGPYQGIFKDLSMTTTHILKHTPHAAKFTKLI